MRTLGVASVLVVAASIAYGVVFLLDARVERATPVGTTTPPVAASRDETLVGPMRATSTEPVASTTTPTSTARVEPAEPTTANEAPPTSQTLESSTNDTQQIEQVQFADRSWEQEMARRAAAQDALERLNDASDELVGAEADQKAEPEPAGESVGTSGSDSSAYEYISPEACEALRQSFPMYADPEAQVIRIERELRESDPEAAAHLRHISCIPKPTWIVGGSPEKVREQARVVTADAARLSKIPIIIIYSIPGHSEATWNNWRDGASYEEWIRAIGEGIDDRQAWVILEPDALLLSDRYSAADQQMRIQELGRAAAILREETSNMRLYLDAGHSKWSPVDNTASLINRVGAERFDGISLNVSNYHATEGEIAYGRALAGQTDGLHVVIDVARNGNGAPEDLEWCNAPGRAIGERPTFATGDTLVDALLWLKPPGESDGHCNGGGSPGTFFLEYALDLVRRRYDL